VAAHHVGLKAQDLRLLVKNNGAVAQDPHDLAEAVAILGNVSVAAKKGASSAVETEPGAGLRSGLRWAQEMGKERLLASLRPDCPRF
jgi:hypothetical protein